MEDTETKNTVSFMAGDPLGIICKICWEILSSQEHWVINIKNNNFLTSEVGHRLKIDLIGAPQGIVQLKTCLSSLCTSLMWLDSE